MAPRTAENSRSKMIENDVDGPPRAPPLMALTGDAIPQATSETAPSLPLGRLTLDSTIFGVFRKPPWVDSGGGDGFVAWRDFEVGPQRDSRLPRMSFLSRAAYGTPVHFTIHTQSDRRLNPFSYCSSAMLHYVGLTPVYPWSFDWNLWNDQKERSWLTGQIDCSMVLKRLLPPLPLDPF